MTKSETVLKELLESKGLKKAELARRIKVSPQYLGQITSGLRAPSADILDRLEKELDLQPGELTKAMGLTPKPVRDDSKLTYLMEGVELAYLKTAMAAAAEARRLLLRQRVQDAVRPAPGGKDKPDTKMFDLVAEHAIVNRLRQFDGQCTIFTEEQTVQDEKRHGADKVCFLIDPLDRSTPFSDCLKESRFATVGDAIKSDDWKMKGLDAPFLSINCIRNGRLCFNVMMNYVDGEIYVACRGMLKHAPFSKCPDPISMAASGEDIVFDPREGRNFITFTGRKGTEKCLEYTNHLSKLPLQGGMKPRVRYAETGGPARILYLSEDASFDPEMPEDESSETSRPAFILSNGEKICEWFGWLMYAAFSDQLLVYELHAKSFEVRDLILLAPPPNYSLFAIGSQGCDLILERMTLLDVPVYYRGAIAVVHAGSADAVIGLLGINEGCRELPIRAK
jgi:transcriptional regulator with XRE-family HTH domain